MTLSLLKKDLLLAKRFIWMIAILVIVLPLFILARTPGLSGASSFLLTVLFAELILGQYIAMTELKYPQAETLLCSTPYTRKSQVLAKYMTFMLVFGYCCVVYAAMALVFPQAMPFSVDAVLIGLLCSSLIYGVYTPVQYKLGVERTKYFFMIILLLAAFGMLLMLNLFSHIDLSQLATIPVVVWRVAAAAASCLLLWLSIGISVRIYRRKAL